MIESQMHAEAQHFLEYVANTANTYDMVGSVLDVGSGDINGNNRWMFPKMNYVGCDVVAGPNVDVVSPCHELPYPDHSFDVIVSSECFEHDMHWDKSVSKIMRLLKPNGVFVFTCASTGRAEHGTLKTSSCSLHLQKGDPVWSNYYRNLTSNDIRSVPSFNERFPHGAFYYNPQSFDLYYVSKSLPVPYRKPGVVPC